MSLPYSIVSVYRRAKAAMSQEYVHLGEYLHLDFKYWTLPYRLCTRIILHTEGQTFDAINRNDSLD